MNMQISASDLYLQNIIQMFIAVLFKKFPADIFLATD